MRRPVILLALLGMVILVYSAPMAEAALNKIRCTTSDVCEGTRKADRLIDRAGSDTEILGRGGNDTYVERSGSSNEPDRLNDSSSTSDDTYYIKNQDFNIADDDALRIFDAGGDDDILDLRDAGYSTGDCPDPQRRGDDLLIDCPGDDNIIVYEFFDEGRIETIRFTNRTIETSGSSSAAESTVTAQERTATQEPTDELRSSESFDQAKENASSTGAW